GNGQRHYRGFGVRHGRCRRKGIRKPAGLKFQSFSGTLPQLMLKIRMQRIGRTHQASYRIVVTEHTASPKAGKFVEKLGTYNPKTKARTLDEVRVKYWISVGAQPSATMHNMLVGAGVISAKKI